MEFPDFKSDAEMAEWFEAHNVEPGDLEIADDVVVSPTLKLTYVSEVYSLAPNRQLRDASRNVAATTKGNRRLHAVAR